MLSVEDLLDHELQLRQFNHEVGPARRGDIWGPRGTLLRIVIWWSVFTALTGAAFGLWSLLLHRPGSAFGLGNGAVIDGLEVCRRLRNSIAPRIPVLMLTAADLLDDRLTGFAAGADDYMVKPFALPELLARLRALVRRSSALSPSSVFRLHDLELNPSTREVRRGERRLVLTRMGYSILEYLLARSPAVVLRQELERHLWADDPPGSDALRTHIATLRAEVDRAERVSLLHTHRGVGYALKLP